MILNNSGSASVSEEIQDIFNINVNVSLVVESLQSLLNSLFLHIPIGLRSY